MDARCRSCGRTWKVPAEGKRYRCKQCGGVVETGVATEEPAVDAPEVVPETVGEGVEACAFCRAALAPDATFCAECGARRGAAAPPPEPKRNLSREWGKVKSIVGTLRALFIANAVYAGIVLGLFLLVLSRADSRVDGEARSAFTLTTVLLGAIVVLGIVGAVDVARRPFLWAVILAGLRTLSFALDLADGVDLSSRGASTSLVFNILFTLAHWAAVQQAQRLEALRREAGDSFLVRDRSSAAVKGGAAMARHTREHGSRQKERLKLAAIVGGVLLVVVVAFFLARGPSGGAERDRTALEAKVSSFEAAFARGDAAGMASHCDAASAAKMQGRIAERLRDRGWHTAPPHLERKKLETGGSGGKAAWTTPIGDLEATWEWTAGRWELSTMKWPEIVAGTPRPTIERFVAAWKASNLPGIGALMDPENDDRLATSFLKIVERRGYAKALPALRDPELAWTEGSPKARFTAQSDVGLFETRWEQRGGIWYLVGFKFPDQR